MKQISLILLLIIFTSYFAFAQENYNSWIEFSLSFSYGYLSDQPVYGGPIDHGRLGYLAGIGFVKKLSNRFDLETGLDFSRSPFNRTNIFMEEQINEDNIRKIDLLTIPLNLRIKIFKGFSVSGGIQYDQEINHHSDSESITEQTGVGINFKISKDFSLNDKMILSISPEYIIHDIFQSNEIVGLKRMTEFGLRISYKFCI